MDTRECSVEKHRTAETRRRELQESFVISCSDSLPDKRGGVSKYRTNNNLYVQQLPNAAHPAASSRTSSPIHLAKQWFNCGDELTS